MLGRLCGPCSLRGPVRLLFSYGKFSAFRYDFFCSGMTGTAGDGLGLGILG